LKRGSSIIEFGKLLNQKAKAQVDVQTHWCTVKEIDWDKKTMTATGVEDDLDFYDVLLGLGSISRRPSLQSKCLIGIINNNPAAAFLIECEEIDSIEISDKTGFKLVLNNGYLTINGDQLGGIVDAIELKKQVDKNTELLKSIQNAFKSWIPVPNDGGATLKVNASSFTGLPTANLSNIQNKKIKHG
jgi:hypothetical protein